MTPRFNLLPHRQMHCEWARRILLRQISVVIVIAMFVAGVIDGILQTQVDRQHGFNAALQDATDVIAPTANAAEQERQRFEYMVQQKSLVEALDARRSTSVLLLSDVAQALPKDVYLIRLEENGERFVVEGKATDGVGVARFFERLAASKYLSGLVLQEMRSMEVEAESAYAFLITGRVQLVATIDAKP